MTRSTAPAVCALRLKVFTGEINGALRAEGRRFSAGVWMGKVIRDRLGIYRIYVGH
jgi:hypothetical protein